MKVGKLLTGLVSGAAIGAALGLLFAPKKGADTRKQITETGDSYLKDAKGKINELADSITEKAEALKAKGKANFSDNIVEEKFNQAKAEIHEMKSR
ncbi:MAG: YtxH domain-containing protein [Gillisia sp.]